MNLKNLSDKQLLKDTEFWAGQERAATASLLWHLKEIDERRLYADLKCRCLYSYCIKILKHSEGQASRRVSACRLLRQIPEIIGDIEEGGLKLSQLNMAHQFFKDEKITDAEEKLKIIGKIKNKTARETDRTFWEMRKEKAERKVPIFINESTEAELKKVQAMKSHACSNMDLLLLKMCAEVGRIWDPGIVRRRRALGEGNSRYIQKQVKAFIWERDKGLCTNCGSAHRLEIDHIRPFALGGKSVPENLRLLCWGCNQRKGVEHFGPRRFNPTSARV